MPPWMYLFSKPAIPVSHDRNKFARQFSEDHRTDFDPFLGIESAKFFDKRVYFVILTAFFTASNVIFFTFKMWWLYLPGLAFVMIAPYLGEFLAINGRGSERKYLVDIVLAGYILPSCLCSYIVIQNGHSSYNAPILMAIMICSSISFHSRKDILKRNIAFAFTAGMLCLWLYKGHIYLGPALMQVMIGSFVGTCLSVVHISLLEHKFLEASLNTKRANHVSDQTSRAFYPHQVKAINALEKLESTMPCGFHHATVLVIDVQGSSKIKAENFKEALDVAIGECKACLKETYTDRLECDAYRLKDVYDGFFCSVGFPFILPAHRQGMTPEQLAVELSLTFIEKFSKVFERLIPDEKIFMAVGIASGEIEGYFSNEIPIGYELRGEPLVHASRYEQYRKIIFPKQDLPSHIMIISSAVRSNLPAKLQVKFQRYEIPQGEEINSIEGDRFVYIYLSNELIKLSGADKGTIRIVS